MQHVRIRIRSALFAACQIFFSKIAYRTPKLGSWDQLNHLTFPLKVRLKFRWNSACFSDNWLFLNKWDFDSLSTPVHHTFAYVTSHLGIANDFDIHDVHVPSTLHSNLTIFKINATLTMYPQSGPPYHGMLCNMASWNGPSLCQLPYVSTTLLWFLGIFFKICVTMKVCHPWPTISWHVLHNI